MKIDDKISEKCFNNRNKTFIFAAQILKIW